jgi:predicted adenine nucleotide alpha hydrolase (AANH) superfamily ATPase
VEAYFYNPNIYPEEEFLRRKSAFLALANSQKLTAHIPAYNESEYSNAIVSRKRPERCCDCWGLRLLKTAEFARVNNFPVFTTALLISPYQDIEAIKNIGQRVAQEAGVDFLFRDFRCGFRQAHEEAKAMGMYTQKYCGCKDSLEERLSKK